MKEGVPQGTLPFGLPDRPWNMFRSHVGTRSYARMNEPGCGDFGRNWALEICFGQKARKVYPIRNGGLSQNRTGDTRLFRPLLYRLS